MHGLLSGVLLVGAFVAAAAAAAFVAVRLHRASRPGRLPGPPDA